MWKGVIDFAMKRYGNYREGGGSQVISLYNAGKKNSHDASQCFRRLLHIAHTSRYKITLLCLDQAAKRIHCIVS